FLWFHVRLPHGKALFVEPHTAFFGHGARIPYPPSSWSTAAPSAGTSIAPSTRSPSRCFSVASTTVPGPGTVHCAGSLPVLTATTTGALPTAARSYVHSPSATESSRYPPSSSDRLLLRNRIARR